ncbi:tripartite tricarboxylate transporter TctB family protein [Halalkalibacterium ligniniphilum]|uniref:tripartite tricarboxylate transporter TctB family protein n=1 Tax=Halalkalibacterium ligniniphilum TaxID=1134413 RepID=UPI00034B53A5|nr:tripartite tricarboxylate transporter TctB family protein [Halalkalibacterium ligniniphilum]
MLKTINQKLALVLMAIAVLFLILSYQLPEYAYVPVDSDMMPKSLGFLLLILSVIFYFSQDIDTEEQKKRRSIPKKEVFMLLGVLGQVLVYIFLLEMIGFVITTFLFIICCSVTLGYRNWIATILTAFLFSISVYYLFNYLLSIRLPSGILPF